MYIRPLTDTELNRIREIKRLANMELTRRRQVTAKRYHNNLKPITGKPVILSMGSGNLLIDYELLLKLDRSLKRRGYSREIGVKGHTLVIEYPKGVIELNELPEHQADLLREDLPVIDLSESE